MKWQPIETAPKDVDILAFCNHEADPYFLENGNLTLYGAHAEGMSFAETGIHIVTWGGGFDYSTWEHQGSSLPDWWFVAGSEFEVAANPTHWMPLPSPPPS